MCFLLFAIHIRQKHSRIRLCAFQFVINLDFVFKNHYRKKKLIFFTEKKNVAIFPALCWNSVGLQQMLTHLQHLNIVKYLIPTETYERLEKNTQRIFFVCAWFTWHLFTSIEIYRYSAVHFINVVC